MVLVNVLGLNDPQSQSGSRSVRRRGPKLLRPPGRISVLARSLERRPVMTSKIRIALAAAILALLAASAGPGGLIVAPAQAGITATAAD